MKIIIINNFIKPYSIGGAERVTEITARNLAAKKQEVVLITSGRHKKIRTDNPGPHLKIYRFFPKNIYFNYPPGIKRTRFSKAIWWLINLWNPFVFWQVRKILREEKPDVIHIHNFYSLSVSIFSAALSQRVPVFFTAHDYFPLCKNSILLSNKAQLCWRLCFWCRLWSFWNKLFITKKVRFIFPSHYVRSRYQRDFLRSGPVIPNPIYPDVEEIRRNQGQKNKVRSRSKPGTVFLYIGRLGPHKGTKTLLKAFTRVSEKQVTLLIAGRGELERDIIRSAQKDKRIKYLGFITEERKKEVLLASDILIFPSECFEVSPVTLVEAYSYGLPVIATDLGSIKEHIDPGRTGFLFPYRDDRELTRCIEKFIQKKVGIEEMRDSCFHKAASLNKEKSLTEYIKIMELTAR